MKRVEHPNPQKRHSSFVNLNGQWEFEYDNCCVGKDKKYFEREHLDMTIEVPFCPESTLSGIGNTDFINAVWYRRDIDLASDDLKGTVLVTFGAVDYKTEVYVNGVLASTHIGGYTPFTVDITPFAKTGKNSLCVYALDNQRDNLPRGKQCPILHSCRCDYTRTTGIWQTVYMEILPKDYIKNVRLTPDVENSTVLAEVFTVGVGTISAEVFYKGKKVGECTKKANSYKTDMCIKLSETHLWEVGHGRLYDIIFKLGNDTFHSYFGLRCVKIEGKKFLINNKSVFQRLVLDQGFYEDGIYTAPNKEALEKDVLLGQSLGFNGARPHMKVFEPLYLYYCDKHGYITWGEFPCWGLNYHTHSTLNITLPQWLEQIDRDYSHPSIVGWCPFNETKISQQEPAEMAVHDSILSNVYLVTKALDTTRPCIDSSGYVHQDNNDIFDIHYYKQSSDEVKAICDELSTGVTPYSKELLRVTRGRIYNGTLPLFLSEFGGARWSDKKYDSWGYGEDPKTEQEFLTRYNDLCSVIMDNPDFFGFCYTQLYDIEQEQNGLCYYNRTPKFDIALLKAAINRSAEIEK